MSGILHELLCGKITMRKAILWAFAIYVMAMTAGMLWHVYDACVAVSNYVADHPELAVQSAQPQEPSKGDTQ